MSGSCIHGGDIASVECVGALEVWGIPLLASEDTATGGPGSLMCGLHYNSHTRLGKRIVLTLFMVFGYSIEAQPQLNWTSNDQFAAPAFPDFQQFSPSSTSSLESEREAVDVIMDDLVSSFQHSSQSPSTSSSPNCSRKGSQETEDTELERLLHDFLQNHNQPTSEGALNTEETPSTSQRVDNYLNKMDPSTDIHVKQEPFPGLAGRQPPGGAFDFLPPGYPMGFMGLNQPLPCDFMPQPSLVPPQSMFSQQAFLYPPTTHQFPTTDSRRGSQGTTSFSSNCTSHNGSPSPHPVQHPSSFVAPSLQASAFNAQQFLRMGMFNADFSGAAPSNAQGEDDADKLCAVCNDRAICLHYGARTCEGCKGFFKRTVQKKSKYVCAGTRNCPIDKRYRSRCQYCRFQKCISVGMVKEIVRHGSLSGRRGRLSSKTKTSRSDDQPSPPLPLLGLIVRAHDNCKPNIMNTAMFPSLSESQMVNLLDTEFQYINAFLHLLPQMGELSANDVAILMARSFFPILAVRHCNRFRDGSITFDGGEQVSLAGVPEPFTRFFHAILEEAASFQGLVDWEPQSYCTLQAMLFLAGNTPENNPLGLSDRGSIDKVQSTIVNALKDHCATAPPNKLAKIVQQIDKFDAFHELGTQMIEACAAMNIRLPTSLLTVCQVSRIPLRTQDLPGGSIGFNLFG